MLERREKEYEEMIESNQAKMEELMQKINKLSEIPDKTTEL